MTVKRPRLLLLVLAVSFFRCTMVCGQPSQPTVNGKPVYRQEVYPAVEKSLARMWDSADAVVELKINSNEVMGVGHVPYVRTFHTSRVLRVLKGDLKTASTIVFTEAAGQLELADRILRAGEGEPLSAGARYVVFLTRRHQAPEQWELLGERSGAFRLHDGRVQPQGFGVVADEQRNVTERQFSEELESVARHARPKA